MKLVCPHCGHDGTPETAKTPLGSYGFNYLADDVVCREVQFDAESGRARLSADIKSGGAGANPRLECRSCWQTFPAPEGILWEIAQPSAPEPAAGVSPPAPPEQPPAEESESQAAPAAKIAEYLAEFVRQSAEELLRPIAGKLEALEAKCADCGLAARVDELFAGAAERAQQVQSLSEDLQALRGRLATLETSAGAQAERIPQLGEQVQALAGRQEEAAKRIEEWKASLDEVNRILAEFQETFRAFQESHAARLQALESAVEAAAGWNAAVSQLQQGQQALQSRLDAQAEAIRTLHSAAQERLQQREELHAALQRLEQIAGALGEPKPLPENL